MWLIFGGDQKLINIPKIDILQFLLIVSEPERTNADIWAILMLINMCENVKIAVAFKWP